MWDVWTKLFKRTHKISLFKPKICGLLFYKKPRPGRSNASKIFPAPQSWKWCELCSFIVNPWSVNATKWSDTLKQFVGNLPTNCLRLFGHFVGLALKGWSQLTLIELDMMFQSQYCWFCMFAFMMATRDCYNFFLFCYDYWHRYYQIVPARFHWVERIIFFIFSIAIIALSIL